MGSMDRSDISTLLAKVSAQDEAGNHDEAINILARAARGRDFFAMTLLGKRLLIGDRAPKLPAEGLGMIKEAAARQVPEALAQLAVFQCTGIGQEKSWQEAFNTLAKAAALGEPFARQQLLLLNDKSGEEAASLIEYNVDSVWQRLAEQVPLSYWLKAAEGRTMCESPLIMHFKGFLPKPVCDLLVTQAKNKLKPALVYDPLSKKNIRYKTRTNSVAEFNYIENSLIHFLLQEKMSAACGQPVNHMEATTVLNYQPGEEISSHYDFVDPDIPNYEIEITNNGQRILTFLIYLNSEYSAGETSFPKLAIEHSGKCGEAIFFNNALPDGSPDIRTLHAGRPPKSGEKWIISQFIRNRKLDYIKGLP